MTDPRHTCQECMNLKARGECLAGPKLGASLRYRPVQDLLRHCREFKSAAERLAKIGDEATS